MKPKFMAQLRIHSSALRPLYTLFFLHILVLLLLFIRAVFFHEGMQIPFSSQKQTNKQTKNSYHSLLLFQKLTCRWTNKKKYLRGYLRTEKMQQWICTCRSLPLGSFYIGLMVNCINFMNYIFSINLKSQMGYKQINDWTVLEC